MVLQGPRHRRVGRWHSPPAGQLSVLTQRKHIAALCHPGRTTRGRTSVTSMEPSATGKGLAHEHLAKLFDVGNVIKLPKQMFFFWMRSSIV